MLSPQTHLLFLYLLTTTLAMTDEPDEPCYSHLDVTDELPWLPSAAPDALCFDGHAFRINYDVPEENTRQLEELYDRDAKYEEVPEHLRAYETELEDWDVEDGEEMMCVEEEQDEEEIFKKERFVTKDEARL